MQRSYFIPMLLLGSAVFAAGLYGLLASRIAIEDYYARDPRYVRKAVAELDRETLLNSLDSAQAQRCENMRLHALSAIFVGLVFIVWAFDRRSVHSLLQGVHGGEVSGSLVKAKMQVRSIAFCVMLLLFASGSVVQLRQIMPEWVNHVRARSNLKETERVRAFLEGKGHENDYRQ